MATEPMAGHDRDVSIGRIFSRAFATLRSNPVATLGVAFLFAALPSLLLLYGTQNLEDFWSTNPAPLRGSAILAITVFSILVYFLLWMIMQGALVRATVAFSQGGKASLGECVMAGLRAAVPLFLLGLLSGLAILLGLIGLVVPGVILYVMWSVASPALVEERLGPIEALGRSNRLTQGARWPISGLLLVLFVAYWLFTGAMGLLSVMSHGGLDEFEADASRGLTFAEMILNLIASTITSAVVGAVHTSLYVELRDWKDGPRTESLAEIFA